MYQFQLSFQQVLLLLTKNDVHYKIFSNNVCDYYIMSTQMRNVAFKIMLLAFKIKCDKEIFGFASLG